MIEQSVRLAIVDRLPDSEGLDIVNRRGFLTGLFKTATVSAMAPSLLLPQDPEFAVWLKNPKRYWQGWSPKRREYTAGLMDAGTFKGWVIELPESLDLQSEWDVRVAKLVRHIGEAQDAVILPGGFQFRLLTTL